MQLTHDYNAYMPAGEISTIIDDWKLNSADFLPFSKYVLGLLLQA